MGRPTVPVGHGLCLGVSSDLLGWGCGGQWVGTLAV